MLCPLFLSFLMFLFNLARAQDVDRRNLISLTGSPVEKQSDNQKNNIWTKDKVSFLSLWKVLEEYIITISSPFVNPCCWLL